MPNNVANRLKMAVLEQDRAQLQRTIDTLRHDLAVRHDIIEKYEELVKEKDILEDLVVSTQSENERCEEELKTWKAYAKELEKKVEAYEGPNWQDNPGVPSTPSALKARKPTGSSRNGGSAFAIIPATLANTAYRDRRPGILPTDLGSSEDLVSDSESTGKDVSQESTTTRAAPKRGRRQAMRSWDWYDSTSHEEQVVPALANAEKKHERRESLLGSSGVSIRKMSGASVETDEEEEVCASPAFGRSESAVLPTTEATGSEVQTGSDQADRLVALLAKFEQQTGTALASFEHKISRAKQEEENKQVLMRKQQQDRAEALQQISDMADDVKQYVDNLDKDAEEREERLRHMLKTAQAQAEECTAAPQAAEAMPSALSLLEA